MCVCVGGGYEKENPGLYFAEKSRIRLNDICDL